MVHSMEGRTVRVDNSVPVLASAIGNVLASRIIDGTLKPGSRIGQDAVAAELGSSHVPVREAFRKLEALGLVVFEPRRGVRVAPIDAAAVTEVAAMRAALEILALRQAYPALDRSDFDRLASLCADGVAATGLERCEALNRAFHRALVDRCGMPRLIATIDGLHQASARFLLATWRDLKWQLRSDREHAEITAALRSHDIDRACTVLETHILEAGRALVEALPR